MFVLGYTDKITELCDVRSNILLAVIVCKNSDYKNISVTCISNHAAPAAFGPTVAATAYEWRGRVN